MFKGLKSKLEDGAKKLQTNVQSTVSQYSEQISQQFREIGSAAGSDAGSDAGSTVSRKFFNPNDSGQGGSLNYSVGNALMEEVTEADLLGLDLPGTRQRRDSGGSTHSNESSLSALFASVPGLTGSSAFLDTIDSDMESITDGETSGTFVQRTPREQGYKNRYVDIVKKYNQVVTENNKCRTILQQSQDKAIGRIRKLKEDKRALSERLAEMATKQDSTETEARAAKYEELLEKAKGEITKGRKEIVLLTEERDTLKKGLGEGNAEQALSELVANRVAAEWKERFEKSEEEWTERLNKAEQDAAITIATVKADMHVALDGKDREIDGLRSKCRTLEIQDGQANERWQKKVDELKTSIEALEREKGDMIEMLSEAKAQGVKAVLLEEESKREELRKVFEKEKRSLSEACDERVKEVQAEKEKEVLKMKEELEKTKKERIEEETNQEKNKSDEEKEELAADVRELEEKLKEEKEKGLNQVRVLEEVIDNQLAKHKTEVADLIKEHEEIVMNGREQAETQLRGLHDRCELLRAESDGLRVTVEETEKRLHEIQKETTNDIEKKEAENNNLLLEMEVLRGVVSEREELTAVKQKELESIRVELHKLNEETMQLRDSLAIEMSRGEESEARSVAVCVDLEKELNELRGMLEERNGIVKRMEDEKENLEAELASARELSAMHEHLRQQLEEAVESRNAAECRLMEIEKRAEKAERQLQEDRRIMEEERMTREEEKKREEEERTMTTQSTSSVIDDETLIAFEETPIVKEEVSTVGTVPIKRRDDEEIVKLRGQLTDAVDELERLKKEKNVLEEEYNKEKSGISQLESVLSAQKEDAIRAEETRARLEGELAEISKSLRDLQQVLEDNHDSSMGETEKLRCEVAAETSKREEAERERDGMRKEKETIEKNLEKARREVEENERVLQQLKESLKEGGMQNETKMTELTKELQTVREEKKEVNERLEGLERENEEKRIETEEKISSLTCTLSSLQTEMNETSSIIQSLTVQLNTAKENEKKAEEKVVQYEKELNAADREKIVLEQRASDFETRSSDLIEAVRETEEQRRELEKELKEEKRKREEEGKKRSGEEDAVRRLEEADALNERLRKEFIAKERAIAELRAEADEALAKTAAAQEQLDTLKASLIIAEQKLVDEEMRGSEVEKRLNQHIEKIEEEKKREKEEEEKRREQYATALENTRSKIEALREKVKEGKKGMEECERLKKELELFKEEKREEGERKEKAHQDELESTIRKGESKVEKAKQATEAEVAAAKAELLLQVDELRAGIRSLENEVDGGKMEIAKMGQRLVQTEDERDKVLSRLEEKEDEKRSLKEEVETIKTQLMEAQHKVSAMESLKEEEVKKVKEDGDRQKIVRELQKEVKQLYGELTEKQKELDEAKERIKGLEEWQTSEGETMEEKKNMGELGSGRMDGDSVMAEEVRELREQLEVAKKEVVQLREEKERLQKGLQGGKESVKKKNSVDHYEGLNFAEPTEAEYLRNVLFQYMNERETLGKEIVTLARVIGTVAKFSRPQLDSVIAKEENRTSAWLSGMGSVSHGRH